MNNSLQIAIIGVIGIIIGAIISNIVAILLYYKNKKDLYDSNILHIKRKVYEDYLEQYLKFFYVSKILSKDELIDMAKFFPKIESNFILYIPSKVLNGYIKLKQSDFEKFPVKYIESVIELMELMREDLGLVNDINIDTNENIKKAFLDKDLLTKLEPIKEYKK